MVVQHNMQAMNANRMLNITTNAQSKSTEKLSSGYKINRAADDAAGLVISEKMRKQINGLDRVSENAQDGISAVQTAEGALTEVHSMLQRMNELAVQASNGTNSESDRQAIQDEISQLTTEIDRVSETTKFNEIYLLKGNTAGSTSNMKIAAHDAGLAGKLTDNGSTATFTLDEALKDGDKVKIAGQEYTIGNSADTASTEGYATYFEKDGTTVGDEGNTKLQVGDTITYLNGTEEKTATMVDKIKNAETWENGTEVVIKDEEGHELKYVVAATSKAKADGVTEIKKDEIDDVIAEALDKGHTVTMTKYNDATTTGNVNWEVVKELEDGEISADKWNTIDATTMLPTGATVNTMLTTANKLETTAPTAANVKSVTLDGETTNFTETSPMSAEDFAKAVSLLKDGDQLTIQDKTSNPAGTALTITIADTTDAKKNEYTVEDALALVNVEDDDMDQVTFNLASSDNTNATNKEAYKFLQGLECVKKGATVIGIQGNTAITAAAATVIGSPTKGETASDVISVNEAYKKMADELQAQLAQTRAKRRL